MIYRKSLEAFAAKIGKEIVDGDIQPGDQYIAERNTGPKLLTCKYVDPRNWIVPTNTPSAYSYDVWECFKVK